MNYSFLNSAREEIELAWKIVDEHDQAGENAFMEADKMYPHGVQDLIFVIFTKVCRIVGYEMKGNYNKVYCELQDIVNYCGFALAMIKETK